jgi:hypothetical protein
MTFLSSLRGRRLAPLVGLLSSIGFQTTCECAAPNTPLPSLPLDTVLGPGEVRCGRVTRESELIGGPAAYGQVGRSFRCHNARIRFLVQDGSRPVGNSSEGGSLIDIDRVRADELAPGNDTFRELVSALGALEVRVESIEVRNDGRNGEPGVLRVRGRPTTLTLAPQAAVLSQDLVGEIWTDYELAADSDVIKVTTTLKNEGDAAFGVLAVDFLALGGATPTMGPEFGYSDVPLFSTATFLAGGRGEDVNVGYVCEGTDVTVPLVESGITVPLCRDDLVIGAEGGFTRYVIVGDGSVDSVARQAWSLRGIATGEVGGAVARAIPGTTVSALSAALSSEESHIVNEARVVDGRFAMALPPGRYTLVAHAPTISGAQVRRGDEIEVEVTEDRSATLDLTLGGSGRLQVDTSFDDGVVLPVKLTVVPIEDTPRASEVLHELDRQAAVRVEGSVDGHFAIDLPDGDYLVFVSRGFEFSRFESRERIAVDATTTVQAHLARAIDTTGFLAGEFHQHSLGSVDATVPLPRKVLENAIEGVEIAVSTDHDNIVDFRPFVARLGLTPYVAAFAGNEVSYQAIGHFNVFPWQIDPADPLRDVGSRVWWGKTFFELVRDVRGGAGGGVTDDDVIVQLNHPRSGNAGILAAMQFDPTTARRLPRPPPSLPSLPSRVYEAWSPAFDAIEVNTSIGSPDLFTEQGALELASRAENEPTQIPTLADWFGLLGAGLSVAALGNSDTHRVGEGVGYPRSYLFVGHDDPSILDEAALQTAIRTQKTAVAQGCLVTLTVDGLPRMGKTDIVTGTAARRAHVRLQAPPFVTVGALELYVNGRVQPLVGDGTQVRVTAAAEAGVLSLPLAGMAAEPALRVDRLDHALVDLPLQTDAVVVAIARGGAGLSPTGRGETICISPPLYVDGDADGRFTPWLVEQENVSVTVP